MVQIILSPKEPWNEETEIIFKGAKDYLEGTIKDEEFRDLLLTQIKECKIETIYQLCDILNMVSRLTEGFTGEMEFSPSVS